MRRRKSIKILSWVIPIGSISLALNTGCKSSKEKSEFAESKLFNSGEWILLNTIVDIIIPKTDTPSATEVGVPARIEMILLNNHPSKIRQKFLNGLQFIENQCFQNFLKASKECSENEISQILNLVIQHNEKGSDFDIHPFYPLLKGLTVSSFFSSKEMVIFFQNKKHDYLF